MSISDHFAEFLTQHQEFVCGAKVIVADCNLMKRRAGLGSGNKGETPVFILDPVSAGNASKLRSSEQTAGVKTVLEAMLSEPAPFRRAMSQRSPPVSSTRPEPPCWSM